MAGQDTEKDKKMYNELQSQIKKEQDDVIAKNTVAYKEKMAKEREYASKLALEEFRKSGVIGKDKNGNDITLRQDSTQKAEQVSNEGAATYNDWRAAMMSLLQMYSAWVKAGDFAVKENILIPIKDTVINSVLLPLKDSVIAKIQSESNPQLPILQHFASINESGSLSIDLTRSDNRHEMGDLDKLFQEAVVFWLNKNGYVPEAPGSMKFVNAEGQALDSQAFEKLKKDPEKGLGNFLANYSDLEFEMDNDADNSSPSPSP